MSELAGRVFVFSGETFELALEEWVREQVAAYPHQEAMIRVTALAMRDFLGSEPVRRYKMDLPGAGPAHPTRGKQGERD
jgi:hypothetical protein